MAVFGVDAPLAVPLICGAAAIAAATVLTKNVGADSNARREAGWRRKRRWQAPTGGYFVAYYDGSNCMTRMQVMVLCVHRVAADQ